MGHHAVYAGCQNGKNDGRQAGNILGKKSETDPKWLEGGKVASLLLCWKNWGDRERRKGRFVMRIEDNDMVVL